MTFALDVV